MGVMKKFEQRLEGLVNGTFAKVFKSEVQPVEIAGALQRECDNNATIWNRERTVVPNDFIVELSTPDYERLSPYSGQLGDELSGLVRDYAKQQRYAFMGPIKVHLEKAEDLDTGLYRVRSRTLASSTSQQGADHGPAAPAPQRDMRRLRVSTGRGPAHARITSARRQPPGTRPRARSGTHAEHPDPALDRGQRHPPSDLARHPGPRPQHRSRRAYRRPRRIPCGTVRSAPVPPRRSRISVPPTASW